MCESIRGEFVRYHALMLRLLTLVTQSKANRKVMKAVANVKSFLFLLRILKSSVRPVITASMPPICWRERLDQTQIVPMCLEDTMITWADYMFTFEAFHYMDFLFDVPWSIVRELNTNITMCMLKSVKSNFHRLCNNISLLNWLRYQTSGAVYFRRSSDPVANVSAQIHHEYMHISVFIVRLFLLLPLAAR